MSLIRRLTCNATRNLLPRAGHAQESFWSQGKQEKVPGLLFGETPPPPGQKRRWEWWELQWYTLFLGPMAFMAFIGVPSKPQTGIRPWAKKKAELELREEGI